MSSEGLGHRVRRPCLRSPQANQFDSITVSPVGEPLEATETSASGHVQLRLLNWAVEQVGRYLDAAWLPSLRAVNPDFYAVPYNYGRNNAGAFPLRYSARHNEDPAAIAALLGDGLDVDSMQGGTPPLALWPSRRVPTESGRDRGAAGGGADVNARDVRGCTALHWAARDRRVDPALVEALLAAGAEVGAPDNIDRTALDYATRADIGNEAVAALLRATAGG